MTTRRYDDLKSNAVNFWPSELAVREQEASIIPRLVETQDKFISLLHVADSSPICWKSVLTSTTGLSANLFLKHLMVLTDVGGEKLRRFKTELPAVFADEAMQFVWRDQEERYRFQSFGGSGRWDNTSLHVDGKGLMAPHEITAEMEDVAMLLLFGGAAINSGLPIVLPEIRTRR